ELAKLSATNRNVAFCCFVEIRNGCRKSTGLPSAKTASIWGSAGTELSAIWDGLTTDKPRLSENQILPAESETTDWHGFTPSVLSRPSAWSYSRTSTAFTTPLTSLSRGTRKT